MMFRCCFIALVVSSICTLSFAQGVKNEFNTVDTTFIVPDNFLKSIDELTKAWIETRTIYPNCTSGKTIEMDDSECRTRLLKIPSLIEMSYNESVRRSIQLYLAKRRSLVEFLLGMSQYYYPLFEQELIINDLPLELKHLAIIESSLNTKIISRIGAAGLWQLMFRTGQLYGLEINSLVDERLSPVHSTKAAALYLQDLYKIYKDWKLVIAAYNCGSGNVNKAIRRAGGKRDFWQIFPFLPRETRSYVPIFIAINYVMTYARDHNICPANINIPTLTDTVMVKDRIHLAQVAGVLNLPIDEIRFLNAQYRKDVVPGDIRPYSICLPAKYAGEFVAHYSDIIAYKADSLLNNRRGGQVVAVTLPEKRLEKVTYHKVKSGQTLLQIAQKYGVTVKNLKRWNHLKNSDIQKDQKLKVSK